MAKLKFNKFGLVSNPIGGHCTYEHEGRLLIGEVKGVVLKQGYTNRLLLDVQHFNGDPWPIQPLACMVEMLERDYEVQP